MKHKHILLKLLLAIAVMSVSTGKSLASEYTFTFTSSQIKDKGTTELGGLSWTLSGDGNYCGYNSTKGQQLGSGSDPYTTLKLSTSGISGTITRIVINTSGANSIKANLQVTVGGTAFGNTISLTNTATDYTFEGSASGEVALNYTQTSEKAIYIKSITITYVEGDEVLKEKQNLTFSQAEYSVTLGATNFVEPVLSGAMTEVSYSSDAESVATVNASTGEVSIVGEGTAVITATAAESDAYYEGTASYTITVSETISYTGYTALVGGENGEYLAMSSVKGDKYMEAESVDIVNGKVIIISGYNPVNIMWKITDDGSSSTIQDINGNYLVGYSGKADLSTQSDPYLWTNSTENSSWLSSTDNNRTFLCNTSYKYFKNFAISNIGVKYYSDTYTYAMPFADGYVRTGLAEGKYGTICLPCDVETADMKGIEVYSILGKRVDSEGNPVSLVIAEETSMEAGVPYIFKATAEKIVVAYTGEAVDAPGTSNGLVGVFEDTRPIPGTGNYVISSNTIKKAGANAGVRANYAYIDMNNVSTYEEGSSAKRIFEIGNGNMPNSISSMSNSNAIRVDVYSITGVRLRSSVVKSKATEGLGKGVYIVGGRKVVVK